MSLAAEHPESSWGKRPPPKKSEPEPAENVAKAQPQAKPDNAPKPSAPSPRSEAKKPAEVPPKKASSPQVNALVARLPLLLPRVQVQPRDRLVVSPGTAAVHAPHPVLAPKITPAPVGGTVKMALSVGAPSSTLLASAVNGPTSLVSQPASVPVINMVQVINLPVTPGAENRPKPKSISGGASGAPSAEAGRSPCEPPKVKSPTKRPAERLEEVTAKRKRGRPRKKPDEPPVPENSILRKELSKSKEDSDPVVVPAGSRDPPAGCRDPPAGSRDPPAGSRDPPAGSRDPPAGSRDPPAGSRDPPAAPNSSPQNLTKESSQAGGPLGLELKRLAPERSREERPAEARNLIVAPPRKISPYHLSVIRARVPSPFIPTPFGRGSRESPPLDQPERYSSCEPDLQPTDLSLKSRPPLSRNYPTASGLWAPAGRLQRSGADREKSTEAAGSSEATRQGPS